MKIKLTEKATLVAEKGSIIEVSENQGQVLINLGKATEVKTEKAKKE